jgi:hypothetical protein
LREYFNIVTNKAFEAKYVNSTNSLQKEKEKPESNKEMLLRNNENANHIIRKKNIKVVIMI